MVILSSTRPLFFEFTSEISYPVPEGLIGGILNAGFNLVYYKKLCIIPPNYMIDILLKWILNYISWINFQVGVIFLAVFYFPQIGFSWMNYALVSSIFISLPLIMFSKEEYTRAKVDRNGIDKNKTENIYVISLPKTKQELSLQRGTEFVARG